ncbi:MAG TPA: alpha-hydroxy acid oxidase [Dictyobacter sp.]|jgi:4-hydroxymandelate oxidase|nr:alpha-hydroxy acid oxidase [Dictyobacter sp.]
MIGLTLHYFTVLKEGMTMELINVFDYETQAKTLIPTPIWDHINGASNDEETLSANRSDYARIRLRPRVLVDVATLHTETTILGHQLQMPILIAPAAGHQLVHPDGECATAQAAEQAGTIMIVSAFASKTVEEVAASTHAPLWLQMYSYNSRETTATLVKRAEAAGFQAIVMTVDSPQLGQRERDMRNHFQRSDYVPLANFQDNDVSRIPHLRHLVDTWETVDWLHSLTNLPILLKGILTAEDALLALEHGAAGIIVSNHGGRQLDGAVTGLEALTEIAPAVAGRCPLIVDGGIRRGTDILKSLALGANAVLLGRPTFWGLAVNGAEGVQHILSILHNELKMAMALAGRPTIESLDRSLLKLPADWL